MKAIFTFLFILLLVCPGFGEDKQPNVVILLADDLGSKDLGCYGGPVKTPVLDSLAARGVKFTDFHAGAAVCSPSRATLLTGRQNLRTGIYGVLQDHWHNMHLLDREVTIAEVLQQADYGTAHFGKWHVGMTSGNRKKPTLQDHGFDYWFGLSNGASPNHKNPTNFLRNGKRVGPLKGYSCQLIVDDAIRWLDEKRNPDQPFFLNLWFNEPHAKLAAPNEITSIYGNLKDEAAIYSATIDNTDRAIGRLVAKLEAMGKLDNTIIIYSSDHGSYRPDRNGGLNGNKGSNFQGGLRSPGIFFWPEGIRGGRIESTPSGAVDLLPTICGLAGIDKPKGVHLDGADLSPLLTEKETFKRKQPLFWLSPSSGHLATLREANYTLMGYSDYKLPSDQARKNELLRQMAKMAGIDPSIPNLGSRVTNTTFTSPEYNRLKSEFVRLRTFQEEWIPGIKAGGFSRFALYDLKADPLQKRDISKQRLEVTNRLKTKLLELYKDVMADAPDWKPVTKKSATKRRDVQTASKPNVITLLVDDLGYRDIGCYGGPAKTPVIDGLAAGGARFTDFHSGAPVCSPSRATFLTGRNHIRAGVYSVLSEQRHKMHLLRSETTIAEVLKDEGYGTAHFGKWHLGMPINNRDNPTPTEHGFDYWFGLVNGAHPSHKDPTNFLRNGKPVGPMEGYSCQLVVNEAIDWIDKRDTDAPFFINIWFNEPHAVIAAPDEIVSEYGALNDQAAIYNGTIDNTDRAIGRLVAKLEDLGELDNTIIHYSSDNGSYRQERSGELRGKKGSHYEGGHRVPGIFYWKGKISGGRVEKEPAGAVDLLPTFCGLLGIEKPKNVFLDGSDLTPLLNGTGNFERHQPLFWMNGSTMALRIGNHTLLAPSTARLPFDNTRASHLLQQTELALGDDLKKELGGLDLRSRMFNGRFANPEANRLRAEFRSLFYFNEALIPLMKKGGVDRVQLYDLASDLSQEKDIASENPEIVARMKKQANLIYKSVMADGPEYVTPKELAASKKSQENEQQSPATEATDTDTAKLFAQIDKNSLPDDYDVSRHQAYVDRVMAGLKPEQRDRVGQLWKEKRRLTPKMKNVGQSFVRILNYVANGEKASIEEKTGIHRLSTTKRSTYDAFSYLNRIPDVAYEDESVEDFLGRIFGRLANQEGRVLLKAPTGMDRLGYEGLKTFLNYEGTESVGNCAACHTLPNFTDEKSYVTRHGTEAKPTPSLRNLGKRKLDLHKVMSQKIEAAKQKQQGKADDINDAYLKMKLEERDVSGLVAFLRLLEDQPDSRFRQSIIEAEVLDTFKD